MCGWSFAIAQDNSTLLDRKISLQITNVPLDVVLLDISSQGGFTFSYNADIIDRDRKISLSVFDKSVKSVLDILFEGKMQYSVKGKHIILTLKPQKKVVSERVVKGIIYDAASGNKLSGTSIYDKRSSISVISDAEGRFTIKQKTKEVTTQTWKLNVSKANYRDTIIEVKHDENSPVSIYLNTLKTQRQDDSLMMDSINKSIDALLFASMLNETEKANMMNITDTLRRKVQIGFVPFVGTNMLLSGNTVNDYSVNVLMGYSMGTQKLEVGGLINADRGNAGKVQLAGLGNIVTGSFNGLQTGGVFNTNFRDVKGLQLAGVANANLSSMQGGQIAGVVNVNLKQTNAFQVAGVANVGLKNFKGTQLAGVLNVTLKEMQGMQIAGVVNYATTVKGSQLGFLNVSDSCSGVPIGFLSFVRKGYHKFEISTDEVMPLNVSLRTGVRSFYNIVNAGMQFKHMDTISWSFGYGIGTTAKLSNTWSLNLDLTVNQLMTGNRINNFNPWGKFAVTVDWRVAKGISLAAGPVLNAFWVKTSDPDYEKYFKQIPPYTFYNERDSQTNEYTASMWIGGKLAVRFF